MRSASARGVLLWTAAALVLIVLVVGIYLFVGYVSEAGPGFAANRAVLLLLSSAIVVVLLALAGILVRNLVRLVMDRKRGILGSRLRTKLVFFFLVLVLPPAVVLFYGSATIIKMTVEAVLRTPVETITQYAQEIVADWTEEHETQCRRQAEDIAESLSREGLLESGRDRALAAFLESWRERERLHLIAVLRGGDAVALVAEERLERLLMEPEATARLGEVVAEAQAKGGPTTRLDHLGRGLLVQAAVPIRGAPGGAVVAGLYLAPEVAARLESISSSTAEYRQFKGQRRELIALYLSLIALIFLVTVFGATWMGFYLSRRITEPVQDLAAAAREISAGNLGVRVRSRIGDEVGTLVEAFNEMAARLQESQEVITRSTAELRKSYRELDERRRYIETLLTNLGTGVLSLDEGGRVTTANPAVERILGVGIAPGDDARARFDVGGLEPLRDLLGQAGRLRNGPLRRDVALRRRGEALAVAVQISPLRGGAPGSLGTLVMVEDLTDLLRAQRAAAWREVARRIAHEIKNPLTPIQLAAQRLRKKFEEGSRDLGEVLVESTASIEREVAALKGLVDEFSRYARMPELSPEPVDIGEVVESAVALYRGQPGIRWEVETDPAIGKVRVDREQMRRALVNLVDNALSAMGGKGTIRIASRPHGGPGSVRIEVSDTGPGIPPGDRDRMFMPYFSTKGRGTGLGLAIVHRVVTDHRGSIRVEDNEPHGARFVIEIPA